MRVKRGGIDKGIIYFSPDERRVRKFRRKYRVGDKIRARVLDIVDENRVIIEIGDIKLIAYLKNSVLSGDVLSLEIKQLYPHIILKPLRGGREGVSFYI